MQQDLTLILTILGIAATNVAVIISMMFWTRLEANTLRQEQKEDNKDLLKISRNLENLIFNCKKNNRKIFFMALAEFVLLLIAIIGLFAWNRAEKRADARNMDIKMEAWRAESTTLINTIREEIKEESKNFHGKLCSLEQKYINVMERFLEQKK